MLATGAIITDANVLALMALCVAGGWILGASMGYALGLFTRRNNT